MAITTYGDISPRTAAYVSKDFQKRAMPNLVLELFGQAKPIPKKSSTAVTFRRYNALSATPKELTEGVTPASTALTKTDMPATLKQYGDYVEITDIIEDTHEDPVLQEAVDVLGEQAGEMLERVRFGIVKAGTNVLYANGSARTAVNTALSLTLQRKATNLLARQNGKQITKVVKASPEFGTTPVAASYIGICHVDLDADIRALAGFRPIEEYGSHMHVFPGEIGKVEQVRYVASTVFEPWADAGGAKGLMRSTSGTSADVYPILYVSKDAYGIVPFKDKNAVKPMVLNPNVPRGGDPLGQRGSVGWKALHTAVILNDAWMVRAEVAVVAL